MLVCQDPVLFYDNNSSPELDKKLYLSYFSLEDSSTYGREDGSISLRSIAMGVPAKKLLIEIVAFDITCSCTRNFTWVNMKLPEGKCHFPSNRVYLGKIWLSKFSFYLFIFQVMK